MACFRAVYWKCQKVPSRMVGSSLEIMKRVIQLQFSAASQSKTLIVPDKDADGLDAGVIIRKTLIALGMSPDLISVHLIGKNTTVHDGTERAAMLAKDPKYIIVVDQGSRAAPPIVDSTSIKTLIIDHHLSDDFPENATVRQTHLQK